MFLLSFFARSTPASLTPDYCSSLTNTHQLRVLPVLPGTAEAHTTPHLCVVPFIPAAQRLASAIFFQLNNVL
ncbi:hypothetical protein LR48_Vigan11g115800 [Vigna angularis]|uniref:Uncharacterized protein n=1 Tax=Phaseolus angularis TaxID=3914 RepID=A0A0L9VTN8_PHAAN|nr:hypothetical protein LR48_Vigan11g115800 [Vigna angularis]